MTEGFKSNESGGRDVSLDCEVEWFAVARLCFLDFSKPKTDWGCDLELTDSSHMYISPLVKEIHLCSNFNRCGWYKNRFW